MIYVIIGILILFVSFAFALVSLIREQNRIGDTEHLDGHPETAENANISIPLPGRNSQIVAASTPISAQPAVPITPEAPFLPQKSLAVTANPKDLREDIFPWEEPKLAQASGSTDDVKTIEQIKLEIEKLKNNKTQGNIAVQDATVSAGVSESPHKLSGEFSLKDLKSGN